jgi:type IX secretion system PorP/SprF family membrane protein
MMKKGGNMKRFLAITLAFVSISAKAQDLHFTQYFNAPLLVNPANTGFVPDFDYRIGGNYRTQWATVATNPYKTMSIWGDVQLFNNRFENSWVGIGGALLKDKAGSGDLSSTKVYGSVAYHQLLGLNSLLSAGFNLGYVTKSIDFTKLTFDNQWNGKFFDVTAPTGETFTTNRLNYFDLQVGLNYALFPSDNAYLNLGVSAMHVNRPSETFFANSGADTKVVPRYTVFLNGVFKLNERWIVSPNVYFSKMTTATEIVAGGIANYNLSGDGNTQLVTGLYYRFGDAIAPTVGFQLNDYRLTFNYDATMSSLKNYNSTRGAYEVSLVKEGVFGGGNKSLKCNVPRF